MLIQALKDVSKVVLKGAVYIPVNWAVMNLIENNLNMDKIPEGKLGNLTKGAIYGGALLITSIVTEQLTREWFDTVNLAFDDNPLLPEE